MNLNSDLEKTVTQISFLGMNRWFLSLKVEVKVLALSNLSIPPDPIFWVPDNEEREQRHGEVEHRQEVPNLFVFENKVSET